MTAFPTANYIRDSARTETEMKDAFENWLATTKQAPGGAVISTLTIASGAVTPTTGVHQLETEAAAGTDDLTNIVQTNLPDGSLLWLSTASSSHDVVLKHAAGGAGQIRLCTGVDFTILTNQMWILLRRNGTLWDEITRFYADQSAAHRAFYATPGFGQNTFTGRQEWDKGTDIASAATLAIGTDGNYFSVTGTATIMAIASAPIGTRIVLHFQGSLQITHNAVSLILPSGTNIQTSAGSTLEFISEGSGNWRMMGANLGEGVQVLDRVTVNTTVSNTAAETLLYTFSIPGGTLGTNRCLNLQMQLAITDNAAAAQSLSLRLKYGATTLATLDYVTGIDNGAGRISTIGGTAWGVICTALVSGDGATNAQIGTIGVMSPLKTLGEAVGEPATTTNIVGGAVGGSRGTAAEDSTATKTLNITAQWASAAPQRILVIEHGVLTRM